MRQVIAVLLLILVGCGIGVKPSFTPLGSERFGPSTAEVAVLDSPPSYTYQLLGYAEANADKLEEALPTLKKMAQANGGTALLEIEAIGVGYGVKTYRAKVIRQTP